jgi:hypothetical protein
VEAFTRTFQLSDRHVHTKYVMNTDRILYVPDFRWPSFFIGVNKMYPRVLPRTAYSMYDEDKACEACIPYCVALMIGFTKAPPPLSPLDLLGSAKIANAKYLCKVLLHNQLPRSPRHAFNTTVDLSGSDACLKEFHLSKALL